MSSPEKNGVSEAEEVSEEVAEKVTELVSGVAVEAMETVEGEEEETGNGENEEEEHAQEEDPSQAQAYQVVEVYIPTTSEETEDVLTDLQNYVILPSTSTTKNENVPKADFRRKTKVESPEKSVGEKQTYTINQDDLSLSIEYSDFIEQISRRLKEGKGPNEQDPFIFSITEKQNASDNFIACFIGLVRLSSQESTKKKQVAFGPMAFWVNFKDANFDDMLEAATKIHGTKDVTSIMNSFKLGVIIRMLIVWRRIGAGRGLQKVCDRLMECMDLWEALILRQCRPHVAEDVREILKPILPDGVRLWNRHSNEDEQRKPTYEQRCSLTCDLCKGVFAHKVNLTIHLKYCPLNRNMVKCDYCPEFYEDIEKLAVHEKLHIGARPKLKLSIFCHLCKEGFITRARLTLHMKSHKCPHCSRNFKSLPDVTFHERLHSGNYDDDNFFDRSFIGSTAAPNFLVISDEDELKPLKCVLCDEGFEADIDFEAHLSEHTGFYAYKCTGCSMFFSTAENLKLHTREHPLISATDQRSVELMAELEDFVEEEDDDEFE